MMSFRRELEELERRHMQLAAKEEVTYQWITDALQKANTIEEMHWHVMGAHMSVTARLELQLHQHMTLAHLNELANQAFREDATQALKAQRQTIQDQDSRLHKLVQELRTTSPRTRNLASDWVDQEMTAPPESTGEEESEVSEARQRQPSPDVDLLAEIGHLRRENASLKGKGKTRERSLPQSQGSQPSSLEPIQATGSGQGKGRKTASMGRDTESPTAADASGAGGPP